MRFLVVGGGPAGLYFSLLMKKADPSHDVTVLERNPADATFGWGVVFSEETLAEFREADFETYTEITDTFAWWNAIDIHYRGQTIRSRGHAFSGISRKVLLNILQRRCRGLGVTLEFEREVEDVSLFDGYDVVVAADGVNSLIRRTFANRLGTTLDVHETKYVWFGTDLVFKAFTFIFRENEHGLFQVHAYPFDEATSTFIVECREETWRRAGLDGATEEESIAYCEKLFAEDLGGHSLLSNRSIWFSFMTVKNEVWHHENIVLLGDAAHTAHFTIGSGTKLAMEDAIALVEALLRHPHDLEAAFTWFEMARQPVVERFQEAARESATYFESVKRYADFEPIQFAFNLLTRSGRITYVNLALRDPGFVAALDSWFASEAAGRPSPAPRRLAPAPMFAPLRLRGTTLPNRVVLSATGDDSAVEGTPGERHRTALANAVTAGGGLALTEMVAVAFEGHITPGTPGLYRPEHTAAWARIVEAARGGSDTRIAVLLGHAGRRGSTRPRREGVDRPLPLGNWPLLSASPIPYTPHGQIPMEMDRGDMERVRDDFVVATRQALQAGFDMVELNYGHGYLVGSFISPLSNRRSDEYGGCLENRMRFPLEILDAVRASWPEDRPVAVRISATDWAPGGLEVDEAVQVATMLREHGCDLIDVVAGQTVAYGKPVYGRGFLTAYSDRIRNEAKVPTLVGGGLTTPDQVNTILAAGRADLCILELVE